MMKTFYIEKSQLNEERTYPVETEVVLKSDFDQVVSALNQAEILITSLIDEDYFSKALKIRDEIKSLRSCRVMP